MNRINMVFLSWMMSVFFTSLALSIGQIPVTGRQLSEPQLKACYKILVDQGLFKVGDIPVTRYDSRKLLSMGCIHKVLKISQTLGNHQYLAENNDIHVYLPDHQLADGDTCTVYLKDAGMFDYVTTFGASRRVHAYEYIPPVVPTFDEFIATLKAGEGLPFYADAPSPCPKCKGTRFENYRDGRQSRTRPCTNCKATGKVIIRQLHLISW